MVTKVWLVLVHSIPNNGTDMMDVIHLHVDYSLFHDLMQLMVIQVYVDEVDIENKKNHFVLQVKEEMVQQLLAVLDAYKIMDLLIAKMNYPVVYH
jgi:hypothetical protein